MGASANRKQAASSVLTVNAHVARVISISCFVRLFFWAVDTPDLRYAERTKDRVSEAMRASNRSRVPSRRLDEGIGTYRLAQIGLDGNRQSSWLQVCSLQLTFRFMMNALRCYSNNAESVRICDQSMPNPEFEKAVLALARR